MSAISTGKLPTADLAAPSAPSTAWPSPVYVATPKPIDTSTLRTSGQAIDDSQLPISSISLTALSGETHKPQRGTQPGHSQNNRPAHIGHLADSRKRERHRPDKRQADRLVSRTRPGLLPTAVLRDGER